MNVFMTRPLRHLVCSALLICTSATTALAETPSRNDALTLTHSQGSTLRDQTYTLCRNSRTRQERGQCLLTSVINHEAGGSVYGANGRLLEALLPRSGGHPMANSCNYSIDAAFSHLSRIRNGLNLSRADQLAFVDITLTCQSVAFLQRQLFGRPLALVDCLPSITDAAGVRACLNNIEDVYSDASLNAMRDHATTLFQTRIGSVPTDIANGFSGQRGPDVVAAAMAVDLQSCTQNAVARATTDERREAFASAVGRIVADSILGQMDSATARASGLDQFGLSRRVTCDMVASLADETGGQLASMAQDYRAAQASAVANVCDPANATRMPSDPAVAAILNQHLLGTCNRNGMLAEWFAQATSASGTTVNPLTFMAVDFRARNNQCQLSITGTQAQLASYSITGILDMSGNVDANGTATIVMRPRVNCRYFDDRPGFEAAFCAPTELSPAQYTVRAAWNAETCAWEARSVTRIRN
ncbi:hypothetical protein A8B78_15890 [Jannaschia sp. EhC01]|nr:hypothetical protein A8B78_15890 [Jannaschia sp. EhC01]